MSAPQRVVTGVAVALLMVAALANAAVVFFTGDLVSLVIGLLDIIGAVIGLEVLERLKKQAEEKA